MPSALTQVLVVEREGGSAALAQHVRLVNPDGSAYEPAGQAYVLPAATASALGGVKLLVFGNAIGDAATGLKADVAAAAGDAPTKAEYDALVASYNAMAAAHNALAAQFNRLISGLASSGAIQVPSED